MSMAKQTNPLEIPEILTKIAHILPLWVQVTSKYTGTPETTFEPKTLLICMRVSKLWYQVMLPVFWHTYNGVYYSKAPLSTIHRFSPHFRVFRSYLGHEGPYQCTGLVDLNMSQHCKTSFGNGVDVETQCSLVASNRDLKKLYWHGPSDHVPMDANSLTGLRRINDLMILCWLGSNGLLSNVLQSISGTVTRLGLYSIHGVAEGDLMVDSGNGTKEQLILPRVVKLAYRINHKESKGFEDLVRCCPNLKKLYIIPEDNYDMTRLTKNMQECCSKLEALTVKYAKLDDNDSVALLMGCRSGPGLVRLRFNVGRLSNAVTDAILAYSATLQSIKIDILIPGILDTTNLLRILMECRHAWRVDIGGRGKGTLEELLSTLKSRPWGCKGLEFLGLRWEISSPSRGDDDYNRYGIRTKEERDKKAKDEEERLEAKASRLFGIGWKAGRQNSNHRDSIEKEQGAEEVAGVLGLVEDLKSVKTIRWNDVRYVRLSNSE
ncbi:hypothetical protein BGZ96_006844 [Linnemannia gamsii]|uniref:F-box domain-containing protein n=1 Tax=Linnemannia gamsii TaxID=64522 RepID=A0ABQ7K2V2_9FUNG|nr:hypothetical protein BGZ96_006844 [Linnemannia gamsii]